MKKILVPVDFSDESIFAVDAALQIAKLDNSQLEIIHVIEQSNESFSSTGEWTSPDSEHKVYIMKLIEVSQEKLERLVKESPIEGINVTTRVEVGNAFKHVSQSIAEHNFDLVVMGSKGASGFKELVIGSNAEKVVRYSKCPVLVIKAKTDISSIKNIVLGIDLNEERSYSVDSLKSFQMLLGAQLHVVHVSTPAYWQLTRSLNLAGQAFADKHKLENYSFNIYNASSPEIGIACFATDVNGDMISLVTHGNTGLPHFMDGSLSEDMANHSDKPIFTLSLS